MKANHLLSSHKFEISRAIEIVLLLVVSGLTYLPNLLQATIYRDDWYYAMDRLIGGPGIFQAMFSIDRPARGPFFEAYYLLFGIASGFLLLARSRRIGSFMAVQPALAETTRRGTVHGHCFFPFPRLYALDGRI